LTNRIRATLELMRVTPRFGPAATLAHAAKINSENMKACPTKRASYRIIEGSLFALRMQMDYDSSAIRPLWRQQERWQDDPGLAP
jgi:hypothetical protein